MKKGMKILALVSVVMLMSGCVQKNNEQVESTPSGDYKTQEDNKAQEDEKNDELGEVNNTQTVKLEEYELTIPKDLEVSEEEDNIIGLSNDKFVVAMSIESKDEYIYIGEEVLYEYEKELSGKSGVSDVEIKTRNDEKYVYIELENNLFMIHKYVDDDLITMNGCYSSEEHKEYGEEILMQILDGIQSKNKSSEKESIHNIVGDLIITMPAKYKRLDTEGYINENSFTFKKDSVGVIRVEKQRKYKSIEEMAKTTAKNFLTIFDEALRDEIITMPYGDVYYGEYITEKADDAMIFTVLHYKDFMIKVTAVPEGNADKDVTENLEILRSDMKMVLDKIDLGI